VKKKDLNEIAKIEKAIREKYGEETIQNPKKDWDPEKEKKYLENLRSFYSETSRKKETTQVNGFLVRKSKTKTDIKRTCPVCGAYSFSSQDDLYMTKFSCCFKCYIQYVEDREDRWKSGWRPNS